MKIKNLFLPPDHLVIAQKELAEARIQLLRASASADYAVSMIDYHTKTIVRLEKLLLTHNKPHALDGGESMKK